MDNTVDIRFEGDVFYPSKLIDRLNLPIKVVAEYGKIALKGRYKGQPSPFGIGLLEIDVTDVNKFLEEYIIKLTEWKSILDESGVNEITIDFKNSVDNLVELTLSKEMMTKLISMNVNIEIHKSEVEAIEAESKIGNPDLGLEKYRLLDNLVSINYTNPISLNKENIVIFMSFLKDYLDSQPDIVSRFLEYDRRKLEDKNH